MWCATSTRRWTVGDPGARHTIASQQGMGGVTKGRYTIAVDATR